MQELRLAEIRQQDLKNLHQVQTTLEKLERIKVLVKMVEYFQKTGLENIGVKYFQEVQEMDKNRRQVYQRCVVDEILGDDRIKSEKQGVYALKDMVYVIDKYPNGIMVLYHYVLDLQMLSSFLDKGGLVAKFK